MTTSKRLPPLISILVIIVVLFSSTLLISKFPLKTNDAVASGDNKSNLTDNPYPFKAGETLYYGIYSAGIKVGSAKITYIGTKEIDGQPVSYITLEASAPGFYDFEKIYGNIENSLPIRIERKVSLFGKKSNIIEKYDQKSKKVEIIRKSRTTETEVIKSENSINNIILLLYQFRYRKDYALGDTLQFNLPTKRLEMLVDKERSLKVPEGRYQSIFIRSIPKRFKVWFRKDKDRIPLRIQGAIGFGNTYLALLKVEQP